MSVGRPDDKNRSWHFPTSSTVRICLNVISWYKKEQKNPSGAKALWLFAVPLDWTNTSLCIQLQGRARKKIILISFERWMKKCELVANAKGHTMINHCPSLFVTSSKYSNSQHLRLHKCQGCSVNIHRASCDVLVSFTEKRFGPRYQVLQICTNCCCHQAWQIQTSLQPCSTGALRCSQPCFPSESQPDFSFVFN